MSGTQQSGAFGTAARHGSADLAALVTLVVLVDLSLFVPVFSASPPALAFSIVLVAFAPGYAFLAALFPKAQATGSSVVRYSSDEETENGISAVERVGLSIGISLAIVALLGLALNASPLGLERIPAVLGLSVVVLLLSVAAHYRRAQLAAVDRFGVSLAGAIDRVRALSSTHNTRAGHIPTLLVVVTLLLAVGSVGYVLSTPTQDQRYTELYLLTETGDGELVADDYPVSFTAGEQRPVVVRVENHNYRSKAYTVVVEQQTVRHANGSTTVVEREELDRLRTGSVAHTDSWTREYQLAPTATGDEVRAVFLLYEGSPPETPTVDNADRYVQLQLDRVTSEA